jgi:hypothetical protein
MILLTITITMFLRFSYVSSSRFVVEPTHWQYSLTHDGRPSAFTLLLGSLPGSIRSRAHEEDTLLFPCDDQQPNSLSKNPLDYDTKCASDM